MGIYIGVDGKARKVKGAYLGVDGKARKIAKAYIGDENGKARLVWTAVKAAQLTVRMDYDQDVTAEVKEGKILAAAAFNGEMSLSVAGLEPDPVKLGPEQAAGTTYGNVYVIPQPSGGSWPEADGKILELRNVRFPDGGKQKDSGRLGLPEDGGIVCENVGGTLTEGENEMVFTFGMPQYELTVVTKMAWRGEPGDLSGYSFGNGIFSLVGTDGEETFGLLYQPAGEKTSFSCLVPACDQYTVKIYINPDFRSSRNSEKTDFELKEIVYTDGGVEKTATDWNFTLKLVQETNAARGNRIEATYWAPEG